MAVQTFGQGDRDGFRKWVADHPEGYVWNPGHSCLHIAPCKFMDGRIKRAENSKSVAAKSCALTKQEIVECYPDASLPDNHCGTCNP
jgi:hypothetical protein